MKIIAALLCVGVAAIQFKRVDNTQLPEIGKEQFDSLQANLRSRLQTGDQPSFTSFLSTETSNDEFGHGKNHYKKYHHHARSAADKARLKEAARLDKLMYGGKTFEPKPGHPHYFDFEAFAQFADAQEQSVRKQLRGMKRTVSHMNSSSGDVTTVETMQGCLEINVCVNNPDGPLMPNVCGSVGLSGTIEWHHTGFGSPANDNKFVIKAGVQVGISAGITGLICTNFFVFGEAEFTWKVTGTFENIYSVLVGSVKYGLLKKYFKKKPIPDVYYQRAQLTRKLFVREREHHKDQTQRADQTDELKALEKMHATILSRWYVQLTSINSQSVELWQRDFHYIVWEEVWNPSLNRLKIAKESRTFGENHLSRHMLNTKDEDCSKLVIPDTTGNRNGNHALGMHQALMCIYLKYGIILSENGMSVRDLESFWDRFKPGSSPANNVERSINFIYDLVIPTSANDKNAILDLLGDWMEKFESIADWDEESTRTYDTSIQQPQGKSGSAPSDDSTSPGRSTTGPDHEVTMNVGEGAGEGANRKQSVTISGPGQKIVELSQIDPIEIFKQVSNTLSLSLRRNEEVIQTENRVTLSPTPSNVPVFVFDGMKVTGGVGFSFGMNRADYCSPSNMLIYRLAWSREAERTADGWEWKAKKRSSVNLLVDVNAGDYVKISLQMPLSENEDDEFKIGIEGSLPNPGGGGLTIDSDATFNGWFQTAAPIVNSIIAGKINGNQVENRRSHARPARQADAKTKANDVLKDVTKPSKFRQFFQAAGETIKGLPLVALTAGSDYVFGTDEEQGKVSGLFGTAFSAAVGALLDHAGFSLDTKLAWGIEVAFPNSGGAKINLMAGSETTYKIEFGSNAFYYVTGTAQKATFVCSSNPSSCQMQRTAD